MPFNILNYFAERAAPYIHPLGRKGTNLLFQHMEVKPGSHILEIGCGTGHTLARLKGLHPKVNLHGVDLSPQMVDIAQKRMRFCNLEKYVKIQLLSEPTKLPFPDASFDVIYCESVLAIQASKTGLVELLKEIHRCLKPKGQFLDNESIWRDGAEQVEIKRINELSLQDFGLQQCLSEMQGQHTWVQAFEAQGFLVTGSDVLQDLLPESEQIDSTTLEAWSKLFSHLNTIGFNFKVRAKRKSRRFSSLIKKHQNHGLLVESRLFVARALPLD